VFRTIMQSSIVLGVLVVSCWLNLGIANAQVTATNATLTGTIQQNDGSPVPNVSVQLIGQTTLTSRSDASGTFVFLNVPLGNYRVVVKVKGLGEATKEHIVVAGDMNITVRYAAADAHGLKVIAVVTASNRAQISMQPISVTTLTPQTLADQGETTWQHVLNEIPGVAVGLGTGNTFFYDGNITITETAPDSPLSAQVLQIGGALPYESTASIDSMPISTSSLTTPQGSYGNQGVDLGLIAPNAFSQYTVGIGPGADSPSILDSVGGSLDVSPPGQVDKSHANISIQTDPYGGTTSDAAVALRSKRLSINVTYDANSSPGPLGDNRRELYAVEGSIFAVDGQPFRCGSPNIPYCAFQPYYCDCQGSQASNPTGYGNNYGALSTATFACCLSISSAWEQHSGSASLYYQVSPKITAQVFYEGLQTTQGAYSPEQMVTFAPPLGYSSSFPSASSYVLPTETASDDLGGLEAAAQYSSIVEEKVGLLLGKGQLTLAALQTRTGSSQQDTYPSSAQRQLWGGGCYYDPNTFNCISPALFYGGTYTVQSLSAYYKTFYTGFNRDYSLDYFLPLGERYQLKASYVSSYVTLNAETKYLYVYPAPFNFSCSLDQTQTPEDFNTTQQLHVSIGGLVTDKLNITVSDYFANLHYHGLLKTYTGTDFGNQPSTSQYTNENFSYQTPRLGVVFHPTEKLALRASAGGSFTAPGVGNFQGSVGQITPNNFYSPSCPLLYYSTNQSNPNLKSESAFGFSLGSDIRLAASTIFSLDLYRTNLHGQFYQSQFQDGTINGLPLFINQSVNLGQTRYEGLTAQVRHDVVHGWFSQMQFGFTRGFIVSLPSGFHNQPPNVCNTVTGAYCANLGTFAVANYPDFPYS